MIGTCYTTSECLNKGGTSGGNCAAGESVCFNLIFLISGGNSQNKAPISIVIQKRQFFAEVFKNHNFGPRVLAMVDCLFRHS
jgi:hypothetical protein